MVEGERPSCDVIARNDKQRTNPLVISPHSDGVKANRDRRRGGGRMPPVGANSLKIDEDGRPNNRPIKVKDSPRCQGSQMSAFYAAVYLIRVR